MKISKEYLRRNALPLALGGGSVLLLLILGFGTLASLSSGGPSQANSAYQTERGSDYSAPGGSDYSAPGGSDYSVPGGSGYSEPGMNSPGGYGAAPSNGTAPDSSSADVNSRYWNAQHSNDQLSQARSNEMLDNTTVRDTGNGEVSTLSNSQADPAIAAGNATEVPTAELPTSSDPAPAASE